MPTQTRWVEPELFLEHRGVKVFCTYHDDDLDQGHHRHLFTLSPNCAVEHCRCDQKPCRQVFDVRELSTWRPVKQPKPLDGIHDTGKQRQAWDRYWRREEQAVKNAITAAIVRGELPRSPGKTS